MKHKHIALKFNDGISDTTPKVVSEVKTLQKCLIKLKFLGANESADGKFGPKTETAVKSFQGKHSLTQDGIVGRNTWAALVGVSPSEVEIIPRPSNRGNGHYDLNKIPSVWKHAASPHVPTLVKSFQDQGINDPKVFAYACATICHESSWIPSRENTTDGYAHTPWSGKGLAQITTQENYKMVSRKTGIDFVNHPEYMFDPEKSLRAKAAFYQENNMIPYVERGDYESAAGIYNAGKPKFRSGYTRQVAQDTPKWLPVFQ